MNDPVAQHFRRRRKEFVSGRRAVYDWTFLAILLLALISSVILFGSTRIWSGGTVLFLVFLAGAGFFSRSLLNEKLAPVKLPPGSSFLVLLGVYVLLRSPWAEARHVSYYDALRIAGALVACWAWTGMAGARGRWRWIVGVVLFGMALLCWYALIQHVHGKAMVWMLPRPEQYGMRASGSYICPNHFANALDIVLCLCAGLILSPGVGGWLRVLAIYASLLALPTLFLTQSRSGWLGLIAGCSLAAMLILWRRWRAWFYRALIAGPFLFAGAVAVLWFSSPMLRERLAGSSLSAPDPAVQVRLHMWKDTWQMIKDAPVWGHGAGSFAWVHPQYKSFTDNLWAGYAHNEYLQTWAELGLVGLLILAGFFIWMLWKLLRGALRAERDRDAGLCAAALGAFVASLVHAVFDFNFHIYANVQLLALSYGVACACMYDSGEWPARQIGKRWGSMLLYGALALVCLLLAMQSARFALAYYFTWQGERASLIFQDEEAERLFRRAAVLAPSDEKPWLKLASLRQGRAVWERDPAAKDELIAGALDLYAQAGARNARDYDVHYGQSVALGLAGRNEEAVEKLKEALTLAPNQAFLLNKIGILLRRMGRDDEALPYFEHSMSYGGGATARINIEQIRARAQNGR